MNHVEFMSQFEGYTEEDRDKIELAYILSKDAHRSQIRIDGERYFEHPRRVALIAIQEVGAMSVDDICACLLHDTVEDTKYITVPKIRRWFGPWVADRVDFLSKWPGQTVRQYYDRISSWPIAVVLKGCDRLDNLRTLKECEEDFIEKQIQGTNKQVIPMLAKLSVFPGIDIGIQRQAKTLLELIIEEVNKF